MTYTVQQHIALKRVSDIAASPDGKWLAVSVQRLDLDGAKYVSDLWKLPTNGGPAGQLTRGGTKNAAPRFCPHGGLGFFFNPPPNGGEPGRGRGKGVEGWG